MQISRNTTHSLTEYGQIVIKAKNVLVIQMFLAFEKQNNIINYYKTGESRDYAKCAKMHQNALK